MKLNQKGLKAKHLLAISLCLPLTALAANTRPVAIPDTMTVAEDSYQYFDPTTNDTDVDGDVLYLHSVASQPSNGVSGKYGHNVKYTPTANFCGTDSFDYWVADGSPNPGRGTITVIVSCVNDAPIANNDALTVLEDSTAWTYVSPIGNDSDLENDTLSVQSVSSPANGYTVVSYNSLGYKPNVNFCGTDSFNYTISDGKDTASATVNVTVQCVADRPVANTDYMTVTEGSYAYFDPIANDYDVDGDSVYLHSVASQPANGTAGKYGGNVKYTPNHNFCGNDSFDYYVGDGTPYPGRGTVNVTVNCVFDNDILTNQTLMHAQVSQMLTNGSQQMKISMGYFVFDGDGRVNYDVMNVTPNSAYENTKISAKHINVAINEAHCFSYNDKYESVADCIAQREAFHTLDQSCTMDEMGAIHHPTSTRISGSSGTYVIGVDGDITVTFDGKTQTWHKVAAELDTADTTRWELVAATYPSSSTQNVKGFGYFSDGIGNTNMNFEDVFDQGILGNSARGYIGKTFSNNVNGYATGPDKWLVEPPLNEEYCAPTNATCGASDPENARTVDNFKISGYSYSNVSALGANSADANTYSNIWYYDLAKDRANAMKNDGDSDDNSQLFLDENGLMVQNTLKFFESAAFPTLIYRNTGHIFPFNPNTMTPGPEKDEVQALMQNQTFKEAFDGRHCWTKADTIRTQGHTLMYLGAMQGGDISNLLGLEISKSTVHGFPVVTLSYGRATPNDPPPIY